MTRARAGLEIAVVLALLLGLVWRVGEWLPVSAANADRVATGLAIGVAILVLGAWWRDGVGLRELGLAPSQWRGGWGSAALFTLLCSVLLIGVGWAIGSEADVRLRWLGDYAPGIAGQQLLLQGFFAPRFETLVGTLPPQPRRVATVALASLAFVALHAPNPALMGGVAVAGAFWTWHFLVHRNLLAVVASHLLLGAIAMTVLGPGPMLNLRVGPGALDLLFR